MNDVAREWSGRWRRLETREWSRLSRECDNILPEMNQKSTVTQKKGDMAKGETLRWTRPRRTQKNDFTNL